MSEDDPVLAQTLILMCDGNVKWIKHQVSYLNNSCFFLNNLNVKLYSGRTYKIVLFASTVLRSRVTPSIAMHKVAGSIDQTHCLTPDYLQPVCGH